MLNIFIGDTSVLRPKDECDHYQCRQCQSDMPGCNQKASIREFEKNPNLRDE